MKETGRPDLVGFWPPASFFKCLLVVLQGLLALEAAQIANILIWIWILTDVATNFGDSFSDWWWSGSADFFENSQEAMLASGISKLASAILCPMGALLLFRSNSFHADTPKLS